MTVSVHLDPSTEQRLKALAERTGLPVAEHARELVTRGLDDLEDYYLASATLERVRAGDEKTFSALQVRQVLNRG